MVILVTKTLDYHYYQNYHIIMQPLTKHNCCLLSKYALFDIMGLF